MLLSSRTSDPEISSLLLRWVDHYQVERYMNRIDFNIRLVKASPDETNTRDYFALDIRVDDRDFLEILRETERPFAAAEGHPELAGAYEGLPAGGVLADLAGEKAEKVSLYDCEQPKPRHPNFVSPKQIKDKLLLNS